MLQNGLFQYGLVYIGNNDGNSSNTCESEGGIMTSNTDGGSSRTNFINVVPGSYSTNNGFDFSTIKIGKSLKDAISNVYTTIDESGIQIRGTLSCNTVSCNTVSLNSNICGKFELGDIEGSGTAATHIWNFPVVFTSPPTVFLTLVSSDFTTQNRGSVNWWISGVSKTTLTISVISSNGSDKIIQDMAFNYLLIGT